MCRHKLKIRNLIKILPRLQVQGRSLSHHKTKRMPNSEAPPAPTPPSPAKTQNIAGLDPAISAMKQVEPPQQEKPPAAAPHSTAKLVSKPEVREFRPRKGSSLAQALQAEENKKEQVSSEQPPEEQSKEQTSEESKGVKMPESTGPAPLPAK